MIVPIRAAGSNATKNCRSVTSADEAMKAFWGLPKTVAALPMLALVAIPRHSGKSSLRSLFCLMNCFSNKGVMAKQVASLVIIAERKADSRQTFQWMFLKDLLAFPKNSSPM